MTDNRRLRCTSSTSLPLALLHTHRIRQRPEFYRKLRMIRSATSLCNNLQHTLDNLRCQLSLAANGRLLKLYYSQEEVRCLLTPCSCLIELRALAFENTLQEQCGRAKERKRNHKACDDSVVLHHSGDLIVLFVHVPLDTCKVPPATTLSLFPAPSWCIVEVPGVFFLSGLECNISPISIWIESGDYQTFFTFRVVFTNKFLFDVPPWRRRLHVMGVSGECDVCVSYLRAHLRRVWGTRAMDLNGGS